MSTGPLTGQKCTPARRDGRYGAGGGRHGGGRGRVQRRGLAAEACGRGARTVFGGALAVSHAPRGVGPHDGGLSNVDEGDAVRARQPTGGAGGAVMAREERKVVPCAGTGRGGVGERTSGRRG